MRTGYKTTLILSMPICNYEGDVIGVAQIINKTNGSNEFTDRDVEVFQRWAEKRAFGENWQFDFGIIAHDKCPGRLSQAPERERSYANWLRNDPRLVTGLCNYRVHAIIIGAARDRYIY